MEPTQIVQSCIEDPEKVAQELLDSAASTIDDDLTSENLKTLNEKYKNETPAQSRKRAKKYLGEWSAVKDSVDKEKVAITDATNTYIRNESVKLESRSIKQDQAEMEKIVHTIQES